VPSIPTRIFPSARVVADARAPSAPVVARKSLRSIFFIGYLRVPGGYARAPGIVKRYISSCREQMI
jgi:hypothetical protein